MTSIIVAFHLALAKTLVAEGMITREDLVKNFNEVRKLISHQSSVTIADREILKFLGIEEVKLP